MEDNESLDEKILPPTAEPSKSTKSKETKGAKEAKDLLQEEEPSASSETNPLTTSFKTPSNPNPNPSPNSPAPLPSLSTLNLELSLLRLTLYTLAVSVGLRDIFILPLMKTIREDMGEPPAVFLSFQSTTALPWSAKPLLACVQDLTFIKGGRVDRVRLYVGMATVATMGCAIFCHLFSSLNLTYLTGLFFILTGGAVIEDCIGQSLTVRLMRLYILRDKVMGFDPDNKKVKESTIETASLDLSVADSQKSSKVESSEEAQREDGETEGKKVYGYYVTIRFGVRRLSYFLGGLLANDIPLQHFFAVFAGVKIIYFSFLLLKYNLIDTRRDQGTSFWESFKQIIKIIVSKPILLPTILSIIVLSTPNLMESGNYIVQSKYGWSKLKLSINSLISSILYFFAIMVIIKNMKKLPMMAQLGLGAFAIIFCSAMMFRFTFEMKEWVVYATHIVYGFFSYLQMDMFLIPIIARLSEKCPKGLEGFAITLIAAIIVSSIIISGYLGAADLNYFDITDKDYSNFDKVCQVALAYSLVAGTFLFCLGK